METKSNTALLEEDPFSDENDFIDYAMTPEYDDPYEYQILKGGLESTGEHVSGQKMRMDYARTTDGLIQKITNGIEVVDPETGEKENKPYSTIIFLDKSGRPVSHLVREFWPLFAKDLETGEVPPLPDFKFLNIDRRQWVNEIDPDGTGIINTVRLDESVLWSLRSVFLTPEGKRKVEEEGLSEAVESMPATLDNQTIMIVDETHYSGETLKIATELLEAAFPTSTVGSAYWIREKVNGHNRNPIWYDDTSSMGRGVNERYSQVKKLADVPNKNYYQKFGAHFLSAAHWRVQEGLKDEKYQQLVNDIKQLAHSSDVPYIPSFGRPDAEERIVAYNTHGIKPSELTESEKDEIIDRVIQQKNTILDNSKNRK